MDNFSHSRLPNRGSTSISKKICNGSNGGGPFVAQTIYDDVYGGPPKFGVSTLSPRFEDYGEIFGSFHVLRASSIPILDLPSVDESEVFFDARSSGFDYAEVFGGFDDLKFAISYEELVGPSTGVDDGSSDEAWTPAGTESLSDCSDHSGNSHCITNGDSNQSFAESTEFSLSYNKVNREGNGNISNGKLHVTQLEMLPGFSYLVDEANPSLKGTYGDPSLQINDDSYLNIDFDTGKVKSKCPKNTMSSLVNSNDSGPLFEDSLISHNGYGSGVCRSHEDFITVSEISLRTEPSQVPPPSRPPPKFSAKKGDYTKMSLNFGEAASEIISDDHFLPLFDVEVDASSFTAASAAAMKEAMEKAQARLQNAKDLWERKKDGVHGRMRLDAKNDMREKEGNLTKIPNRFKSLTNEMVQGIGEIHDHNMSFPSREERQKDGKATEVCSTPFGGEELLTVAEKTGPITSGSRFLVYDNYDCCSEWKDATEFFKLARADISGKEFKLVNYDEISNFLTGQMGAETIIESWDNDIDQDKKGKPFHTALALNKEVNNLENMVHEKEEECDKGTEDSLQRLNIGGMPSDVGKCKVTQMLVEDCQYSADLKGTSMEHDELEILKDGHKISSTIGSQAYVEVNDLGISAAAFQMNDDKNHLPTGLTCSTRMPEEFFVVDESGCGERKTIGTFSETSAKMGGIEKLQSYKNSCAASASQAEVEHHKVSKEMEDTDIQLFFEWTKRAGNETSFLPKPDTQAEATNSEDALSSENSTSVDEGENEIEENVLEMEDMKTSPSLDRSDEKAGQADVGMEEFVGRKKFVTRMDPDPEHPESNLFCHMEDKVKSSDQVEDKGQKQKVSVQGVNARAEKRSGLESTRPSISERIPKSREFAHEVNSNQATERKENIVNQSHTSKGKDSERVRSEAEFENDILRKLEEEREREREREKDRMHIDKTLEPCDRVGAEARERAERAGLERMTAEARQRSLAEARERLEKACAEARESSLAGKATKEARVKAERAAVERATAQAREWAAEKAKFDRTSFGVKERMERSVSDNFSASSRNNEMRQKSSSSGQPNLQSQSFGSSIASRYAYYSAYDERNEGVDGETPQRCKARLERHQRTAERAAKALAEKNICDLLVQREQAERSRLAETLDADVRRWSSGKEGNLRALLSTLQYILGPDSGWQPIPLTEVITAAAVKKAYRKATLCVHPDKLQQRGASIQQKYICEKVFDLLKEAWNKFNSEER